MRGTFFGGVCAFRSKNIFYFIKPSQTRATASENMLAGAACQRQVVGEVLDDSKLEDRAQ